MAGPPPSDSDTSVYDDARDNIQAEEAQIARRGVGKRAQSAQLLRDEQDHAQASAPVHALTTFKLARK